MSRLVFLCLEDREVDVLSRLSGIHPRPEVLVVHPDPESLVRRLADLAELPVAGEPPRPRRDDLVIASEENGAARWVDGFRDAGATVMAPGKWDGSLPGPSPEPELESKLESEPEPASASPAEPTPAATPVERPRAGKEDIMNTHVDTSDPVTLAAPSPDIWTDPGRTFAYLIKCTGSNTPATLWWDGGENLWVPWFWTGSSVPDLGTATPEGTELNSEWGRFVVSGSPDLLERLPVDAVRRVAEDAALRDLMTWRKTAQDLASRGLPKATAESVRDWAGPVLRNLGARAILVWLHAGSRWTLVEAQGEGLKFTGDLVLSQEMLDVTFAAPGTPWERWQPLEGFTLQILPPEDDPRWPLRLARVRRAVVGDIAAW
jgi:hypothetical protein